MARPATSPAVRVAELRKALDKAKKLPRKQTLTAKPMSELLGVSWPTLQKWCDDIPGFSTSQAFVRGDRGIEWTFHPVATVNGLIKHFEAEREARAAKANKLKRIITGSDATGPGEDLSIEELAKTVQLYTQVQSMRERDGSRVDAGLAASAITTLCSEIQQAVMRSAQEEDPTGEWPAEVREAFENSMRRILLRIEQAGEKCLRTLRGVDPKS